jgi:transcription initiation factor IIE alpha subunit
MKTNLKERNVRFFVQDGCLVRTVTSDAADGRAYSHRCDLATYETVAHAVAETPAEGEGTTLTEIARREGLPYTRVNVALEYLKERGLIDIRHRRCFPATTETYLDAMVEYHALAEEPKSA